MTVEQVKETKIISGFPGVGKSVLALKSDLQVLDSDSSSFSWSEPGVRHPDFPNNYIEHIKNNLGKVDIILISSHEVVREALEENEIDYTLVYPNILDKDEYLKRYKERGSDEKFIAFIDANWDKFIKEIEMDPFPTRLRLNEGQYLSDILQYI